jgi:hypothetical protein
MNGTRTVSQLCRSVPQREIRRSDDNRCTPRNDPRRTCGYRYKGEDLAPMLADIAYFNSLSALDFSLLLPDVMTIADEVDSQLTQAEDSYMGVVGTAAAA